MLGVSFERLVAGQAGVVSLAQAVAAGMSPDTVQRRVRQGRWTRLHPGIYLVGGHRHTPKPLGAHKPTPLPRSALAEYAVTPSIDPRSPGAVRKIVQRCAVSPRISASVDATS